MFRCIRFVSAAICASAAAADSCWSDAAFGPTDWKLSYDQCAATRTNWGGSGMAIARAAERLQREGGDNCSRKGLSVLAVGGSITAGHPAGKRTAWPARLEHWLNVEHPVCDGSRHTVLNGGAAYRASDHWHTYFLQARADAKHPVHQADVILIETAANDVQDMGKVKGANKAQLTEMYTELIVRTLRSLQHKPFFMWCTVG